MRLYPYRSPAGYQNNSNPNFGMIKIPELKKWSLVKTNSFDSLWTSRVI